MIATLTRPVEIQPAASTPVRPRFAFEIKLRPDCLQLPQPPERPDFDNPGVFASLAVYVAAYGTFVFSVAARPAYAEGSLRDWLFDLCRQKGLEIERAAPVVVDGDPAATCLATQKTDAGLMKVRITLLEDDGRLFVLTATAPAPLWRVHNCAFEEMFDSFKLVEKFGRTVTVA